MIARPQILLLALVAHTKSFTLAPPARHTTQLHAAAVKQRTALPATLPEGLFDAPKLTATEQLRLGRDGELRRTNRRGRGGECLQVVETALSPEQCWKQIRDVAEWSTLMRGVKSSRAAAPRADGVVRANFAVTKLRLPCALLLKEDRSGAGGHVLDFTLDPESPRVAVQRCSGRWTVERAAGGRTRVSLCAEIKATRLVPGQVVDYVATRALDRAVAWIPRARSSR